MFNPTKVFNASFCTHLLCFICGAVTAMLLTMGMMARGNTQQAAKIAAEYEQGTNASSSH